MTPNKMEDALRAHASAHAEHMEAFIAAQLRVSGINPCDVCMVVDTSEPFKTRYYLEFKPR